MPSLFLALQCIVTIAHPDPRLSHGYVMGLANVTFEPRIDLVRRSV